MSCSISLYFFSLQLPDEIIVKILGHLPLVDLLKIISRVCKKLNHIVQTSPSLWKNFEFEYYFELSHQDLKHLLSPQRIAVFRKFCIPEGISFLPSPKVDELFFEFRGARRLQFLDLTGARLSSLSFVGHLSKLEVLILDSCQHIQDCDIEAIEDCKNLQQLYIGNTHISPAALIKILPSSLNTLECSGIKFTVLEITELLNSHPLSYFTFSLKQDSLGLRQLILSSFLNTSIAIVTA